MSLSTFGEKLRNILLEAKFPPEDTDKVVTYLDQIGDGFLYPNSIALNLGIPIIEMAEIFSLLTAKGALIHFSVPRYQGKTMISSAIPGFQFKFENLQDSSDYFPIDSNDIDVISGFKIRKI